MASNPSDPKDLSMAEIPASPTPEPRRRLRFDWVIPVLSKPGAAFQRISASPTDTWLTPLLLLTITALASVLVAGPLRQSAALLDTAGLPPDFQYFTPDQQAQYMQALQSTSSVAFVYVLPAIAAVLKVWVGWLALGGLVHLILTLLGGRVTMRSMLNLVAWAGLPFAGRDLVRVFYMLAGRQLIHSPGLSGFVTPVSTGTAFIAEVLEVVDVYWVWHIILLLVIVRVSSNLSRAKIWATVISAQVAALAFQAAPGAIMQRLSGLNIIRPFFF